MVVVIAAYLLKCNAKHRVWCYGHVGTDAMVRERVRVRILSPALATNTIGTQSETR